MQALRQLSRSQYSGSADTFWGCVSTARSAQAFSIDSSCNLAVLESYLKHFPLRSVKNLAFVR